MTKLYGDPVYEVGSYKFEVGKAQIEGREPPPWGVWLELATRYRERRHRERSRRIRILGPEAWPALAPVCEECDDIADASNPCSECGCGERTHKWPH